MEKKWKDEFRITDEDNATFDYRHSEHIEAYLNTLRPRMQPHNDVDLARLETNNFYTRKIEIEELQKYLKRIKKKKTKHQGIRD